METWGAPELASSQGAPNMCRDTGSDSSERNSETRQVTFTHQMIEKIPTSNQVGETQIHSHHVPHPPAQDSNQEGTPKLPASP